MKAKEVRKLLGIAQFTMYRYLKEGKVKLRSKLSKTYRFLLQDYVHNAVFSKFYKQMKINVH